MKCRGNFVFKSLNYRDGGSFKNSDGVDVPYKPAYVLKVDEVSENGEINERKFKVAEDKKDLLSTLQEFSAYQKIELEFEVIIYATRVSLELFNALEID